jgi:hypothetical protein
MPRLLSPLLVLLAGCGTADPMLVPVSGRLTLGDKPLGNVQVDFHPDPDAGGAGPSSSAVTDADGKFTLVCQAQGGKPGAVVGNHRVVLTDLDRYGNVFVGRGDYRTDDPKGPKETPKLPRFPATYSDLTRPVLKQAVSAGMAPVTLVIKK